MLLAACGVAVIFDAFGRHRFPDDGDSAVGGLVLALIGGLTAVVTVAVRIYEGSQRIRQANTYYAVTDRRAISWIPESKDGSVRVRSLGPKRIQEVARVERPDGSGTLEFTLPRVNPDYPVTTEAFKHIPEVRRVEQLVRNHLTTFESSS